MNDIYLKLNIYLHNHHTYKKIISFLEKYLTALFIFIYPCMIIYLIKIKSPLLLITLIKPLSGLITVKCMRKVLNRPRPFEILPLTPAVFHNPGESFPSNHTFNVSACFFTSFDNFILNDYPYWNNSYIVRLTLYK